MYWKDYLDLIRNLIERLDNLGKLFWGVGVFLPVTACEKKVFSAELFASED